MHRLLSLFVLLPALAGAQQLTTAQRMDRAWFAWDAGRYEESLTDLRQVLAASDADAFHDRVAELTGEIWQTREVAKDARAPRWSPDGRHLSYEWASAAERRVRVVRAEAGFPVVRDVEGSWPSFAPDGRSIAWLANDASGRPAVYQALLDGSAARLFPLDAAAATSLVLYGTRPLRVAVLTRTEGTASATLQVRELGAAAGAWTALAIAEGQPVGLVRSTNGARLLVALAPRGGAVVPAPVGPGTALRPDAFALVSGDRLGERVPGTLPVLSADGAHMAWLTTEGRTTTIHARRGDAAPARVHASETPVQGLSISPDGARVAWQTMLREDWEILTAPTAGGSAPDRVTREIQHDLFPQFVAPDRLLAVMGEARHRRSHLYDLATGTRTRLFHNNSVRTVAPEYEWVASPDGSRVAIVSERDGDTVTPHRHLYLTDLTAKVSRSALLARVDSNLTAERVRRVEGARVFAPIAAAVRAATSEVDVGRIYATERDLFAFDSKHITQPGNWKATEYLLAKYRAYGLDAHLQRFTTVVGREIEVANVVAVIPGTVNPELVYVVGAHFDSHAQGPGADDNTSGTAMILEAARVLASRPQPATVMFVAFTGEESGLRGAREFGRRMKDSIRVVGALNNDMMGWSNDHRMDNTIRYSNPGIRDVQHAAAMQFSRLITYDAFYFKSTDAHALFDAWGDIVGGIGSYPILGNPHYHMPHDVLETINHQQVAETSRTTVATIMLLASSPSRLAGLAATGTQATWTASPEKGVARYLVRWGPTEDPMRFSATVTSPRAALAGAAPGWKVAVKAVTAAGLEGWDWARADVR